MTKHPILQLIPDDQIQKVFGQDYCDIDYEFLGFLDIYEALSKIIPKHFTVIDLGCAYNAQCFYFTEHKKYIAVDISDCEKFCASNTEIHVKSIEDFIKSDISDLNLDAVFAICSYVPNWGGDNRQMVRNTFPNVYTYFPCTTPLPIIDL